ncbi:hypothetical protein C9994_01735 [Marivirga lumbricoides]|uniref:PKD domain-containing protein n=1 Tax=Marivirga lumbricoides TaxID=1046115 RepID=A0A2T4DV85_9BACT|nr:hypothetical protein C9994_01735 [Marivirga lumbricoides]
MRYSLLILFFLFSLSSAVHCQQFNQQALVGISEQQKIRNHVKSDRVQKFVNHNNLKRRIALGPDKDAILSDVVNGIPYYLTTHNLQARKTTGVDYIQSEGGLNLPLKGGNMIIGVWDGGLVLNTHQEFQGRIKNKLGSEYSNHATHVTGTIAAAGINPEAKGMLPNVNIHSYYAFEDDLGPMAEEAANGLILSNHSYGLILGWNYNSNTQSWQWFGQADGKDNRFGAYTSESRTIDNIAYNAPYYTIVWSAGNDRSDVGDGSRPPDGPYDLIGPSAGAKNIITVGAITGFEEYSGPTSAVMSGFSSWGPTDDGRIKPDIVADGVGLLSTSSAGVDSYTTLSGTSMSAPNVTGSLGVLQEYYRQSADTFMTAAQLKSLAIHTAREAGTSPGPDYKFGWGVLNCIDAIKTIGGVNQKDTFMLTAELLNNDQHEYQIIPDTKTPITATIAWTDVPGLAKELGSTNADLINDLDIYLVDDAQNKVYPWKMNLENRTQAAQKGDNIRDNVEKIEFLAPSVRNYKLIVKHKGTLQNNAQKYALTLTYGSANVTDELVYWVNDGAILNEAGNFSLESGGEVATISVNDLKTLVIDENSFSTEGIISLSEDISLETIIFNGNKEVTINLNGHVLNITNTIYSNGSLLKITNGVVNFSPLPNEDIYFNFNGSENLIINLTSGGAHEVRSDIDIDNLVISSGTYNISNRKVTLKGLSIEEMAVVSMRNNQVDFTGSFFNQSKELTFLNNNWNIRDANFNSVQSLIFDDIVNMVGDVSLSGKYEFQELVNSGQIEFKSITRVDSLILSSSSSTVLYDSLYINKFLEVEVDGGQVIEGFNTGSQTTMILGFRKKMCFDNITFNDIQIVSESVINVDTKSSLNNTTGILQIPCKDLIFADFEFTSFCANSLISINNKSTGEISSYSWQFGNQEYREGISDVEYPMVWFDSAGIYDIKLTISNTVQEASYIKTVEIVENVLPEVKIVENNQGLVATVAVQNYQWFKDGIAIEQGGKERILSNISESGEYSVAYFSDGVNCSSRVSPVFEYFITSNQGKLDLNVKLFPNPVNNILTVESLDFIDYFRIFDSDGKVLMFKRIRNNEKTIQIELSSYSRGLYFIEIYTDLKTSTYKFLIN